MERQKGTAIRLPADRPATKMTVEPRETEDRPCRLRPMRSAQRISV